MDFFKRNWMKILSTIIGGIVSLTILYQTVETHGSKIEQLETWKQSHEVKSAEFMAEVLTELKNINKAIEKLDK